MQIPLSRDLEPEAPAEGWKPVQNRYDEDGLSR
jgi:hypothetical protein